MSPEGNSKSSKRLNLSLKFFQEIGQDELLAATCEGRLGLSIRFFFIFLFSQFLVWLFSFPHFFLFIFLFFCFLFLYFLFLLYFLALVILLRNYSSRVKMYFVFFHSASSVSDQRTSMNLRGFSTDFNRFRQTSADFRKFQRI